jgi:hypothetical protein
MSEQKPSAGLAAPSASGSLCWSRRDSNTERIDSAAGALRQSATAIPVLLAAGQHDDLAEAQDTASPLVKLTLAL